MKNWLFIFSLFLIVIGCSESGSLVDEQEQLEIDRTLIMEFIADNNIDAIESSDGIFISVDSVGNNTMPSTTDSIEIDYRGYYLDGFIFDSSYDNGTPLKIFMSDLIQGWQLGMPSFGEGGKGTLIIPSKYGYGSSPPGSIRRNAVLVFDVDLIDVY